MPRKNLVWLASYPKSGNTWTRIFLANYLFNRQEPLPINEISKTSVGDSVAEYYRQVSGGKYDPTNIQQTIRLRPKVLRGIAANNADVNIVKSHLPVRRVDGVDFIPPLLTRAAIYILRHPFDMVVSYSRHFGVPLERAVRSVARVDNITIGEDTLAVQPLGNWSDHVRSWSRARGFPVLTVRYEDMKTDPEAAFTRVLEHMGVPVDADRLDRAIRFSSFDELRQQEEKTGFKEKAKKSERFFAGGKSGHGRDALGPELCAKIERQHGAVMREFGYL